MIDLKNIVSRISVGKLCPSMTISTIEHISMCDENGQTVPCSRPAIGITMHVFNAINEEVEIALFQCCPLPRKFTTEDEAVEWVYDRIKAVLLHELNEFFKFDGNVFRPPVHPIPEL